MAGFVREASVERAVWRTIAAAAGVLFLLADGPVSQGQAAEIEKWVDATGKYTIEASFVSEADGVVTLQKANGDEVEVPLAKLNTASQERVKELLSMADDNPFKPAGSEEMSPFETKERSGASGSRPSGRSRRDADDEDDGPSGPPRQLQVDVQRSELIASVGGGSWKVTLGEPVAGIAEPRPTAFPGKSNFFEKMLEIAISNDQRHALVVTTLDEPKPEGSLRLSVCDLERGKATTAASTGRMAPLALHNDGEHVIMRRAEFGFGNADRLEIWQLRGRSVRKLVSFVPHDDARNGSRDVQWARFLGDDRFVTSGNGMLVIWSFPDCEPIARLPAGGRPALSPDGRLIAWCDAQNVGIFDVEAMEVVAQQPTPDRLHDPKVAFSPSGKRLACIAQDRLLVWNTENGDTIQDMKVPSVHIFTGIDFPDEDYVLGGNQFLIGVENQVLLWTYSGQQQVTTAGPWTYFGTFEDQTGAMLPMKIPHPGAINMLAKASSDPNLFVLKEGTRVRLDVSGLPNVTEQNRAIQGLVKRVAASGSVAEPDGKIVLVASVEGPTQETLSLRNSGDYTVQKYVTRLKYVYEGQVLWQTSTSNVPGGPVIFFNLEDGENIGDWLKKREKPDYELFQRVELPRFLQKPNGQGGRPSQSMTIGTSKVTGAGLR
jgi:hypothetical protein